MCPIFGFWPKNVSRRLQKWQFLYFLLGKVQSRYEANSFYRHRIRIRYGKKKTPISEIFPKYDFWTQEDSKPWWFTLKACIIGFECFSVQSHQALECFSVQKNIFWTNFTYRRFFAITDAYAVHIKKELASYLLWTFPSKKYKNCHFSGLGTASHSVIMHGFIVNCQDFECFQSKFHISTYFFRHSGCL